ncbi:MAG: hypothetical protein HY721_17815 [Planctomycetes bacterium]|nr:hypothetical protein [Planctomycetota bacterium]
MEFDDGAAYLEAFRFPEDSPDPERYYSFEHGNALFVALDTNQDVGAGSRQLGWLRSRLAASEHAWKVVFFHHAVQSSAPVDRDMQEVLVPVFEEHRVDLVVQGHLHFYERTFPLEGGAAPDKAQEPDYEDPRGTIYLVTGGGGGVLRSGTPDARTARFESRYHHVRVDVDGARLRLEAVDRRGLVIDGMTLEKTVAPPPPVFHRGDADPNGALQLTDAIRVLTFLFLGGDAPSCLEAADADDNGVLQLTDAVRVLSYLFTGGDPPPPPGPPPSPCGADPVGSPALGCEAYDGC